MCIVCTRFVGRRVDSSTCVGAVLYCNHRRAVPPPHRPPAPAGSHRRYGQLGLFHTERIRVRARDIRFTLFHVVNSERKECITENYGCCTSCILDENEGLDQFVLNLYSLLWKDQNTVPGCIGTETTGKIGIHVWLKNVNRTANLIKLATQMKTTPVMVTLTGLESWNGWSEPDSREPGSRDTSTGKQQSKQHAPKTKQTLVTTYQTSKSTRSRARSWS